MTTALLIAFVALALLLACSAFCSAAETTLFSLNSLQIRRLQRAHPRSGEHVARLLARPTQVLSTILVANTVSNISASALGYAIAERLQPRYAEAIAVPVMTLLLLLLCEVVPKRAAMAHAESLAIVIQGILRLMVRVLAPICAVLEAITRFFEKHMTSRPRALSEDEFRTVVEVGAEEGTVDREEKTMVDGIIRMEETQASDVMTPRVDLMGLDLDDPFERNRDIASRASFRFLPVFRGSLDHPEGFLDVRRFLLSDRATFAGAILPPSYVPETAPLNALLVAFQREHRRVSFVTDEFGGTAGVITRGDILEVIAPHLDEHGETELGIQKVGTNVWIIDGSTSLDAVNYQLGTDLEAAGADRISGWFLAQAKRIPAPGDVVEAQQCRVTAQRVRRRRITRVQLEKLVAAPEDEPEAHHE